MFLLTSTLKRFNDKHGSKSKANVQWILVKVSHLNNVWSLQNDILLLSVISKEKALIVTIMSCIGCQPQS